MKLICVFALSFLDGVALGCVVGSAFSALLDWLHLEDRHG